jgi:hypothetical protein
MIGFVRERLFSSDVWTVIFYIVRCLGMDKYVCKCVFNVYWIVMLSSFSICFLVIVVLTYVRVKYIYLRRRFLLPYQSVDEKIRGAPGPAWGGEARLL